MTALDAPVDFDRYSLAEYIEAELLLSDDDYLSVSELRSLLPAEGPSEMDLAFALSEIEDRSRRLGKWYPYVSIDRGVGIDRNLQTLYGLLLILSLRGTPLRDEGSYNRSDPLFDAVAREAFRAHLGGAAEALVFAWPPRAGRPTTFPEAVAWLADKVGVAVRGGYIPDQHLDAGVDIVAWRHFGDGERAFPLLLAQNTVQMSFAKKPRDVQAQRWSQWLDLDSPPQVGFAIPFTLPKGDIWWREIASAANVVLDRGRMLEQLSSTEPKLWPEWTDIADWVASQVADIQRRGSDAVEVDARAVTIQRPRKRSA